MITTFVVALLSVVSFGSALHDGHDVRTSSRIDSQTHSGALPLADCNGNGISDIRDIASGSSQDCNSNGFPDECEPDCDGDGIPDACEILDFVGSDLYGSTTCVPDGIPDSCQPRPDCDGDGYPDDCEIDANNNGIPDDCEGPCFGVYVGGRQTPGSLLLFPRFDSRTGCETVITITNTNPDFSLLPGTGSAIGSIDVEVVYIGKLGVGGQLLDCEEFNRTHRLTPLDTHSFAVGIDNPNHLLGFAYAFARDIQTGGPVVFNHLIGDALFIADNLGNSGVRDAMSARPFLGIGETGESTDRDHDNVRDLDDSEYSRAPAELLIPRFFGQDPNGLGVSHSSSLVLLGLSGARFTTVLDLRVYNREEQPFSVYHQFVCWDEILLRDLSSVFLNDFLVSTEALPDGPLDIPSRTSGWMKVDGSIAFTSSAAIRDPAVFAVLLERAGMFEVADLPWESCAQANGDLFPAGILPD